MSGGRVSAHEPNARLWYRMPGAFDWKTHVNPMDEITAALFEKALRQCGAETIWSVEKPE